MPNYPAPPRTMIQFAARFADDKTCADYLFSLRYSDGYVCKTCGSKRV